jgi:hypothetical protein
MLFFVMTVFACAHAPSLASERRVDTTGEVVAILQQCIQRIDDNLARIDDWQALYKTSYEDTSGAKDIHCVWSGAFSFEGSSGDFRSDATHILFRTAEFRGLSKAGHAYELPIAENYGPMESDPIVEGWSPYRSKVAEQLPDRAAMIRSLYGEVLHPLRLFNQGPTAFRDQLETLTTHFDEAAKFVRLYTDDEGPERRYRLVHGIDTQQIATEWTFSDASACNIATYSIAIEDERTSLLSIEYEVIDDVVLPKRLYEQRWSDKPDPTFQFQIQLSNTALNQGLPPDEFSLEKFGLVDGDRIRGNNGVEVLHVVENGELVTPKEFQDHNQGTWQHADSSAATRQLYLLLCAVLLGLPIVWFMVRRLDRIRTKEPSI